MATAMVMAMAMETPRSKRQTIDKRKTLEGRY